MEYLVKRHLAAIATETLSAFPVLVIHGARQVGKSTFAHTLAAGRPARMFTLDDQSTTAAVRNDPQAFVDQFPSGTLVVDEVQRAPEIILAIKAAVDRDRRPGRFILTGSSDLLRLERTPDSLAGRATTVHLRGFSQGEETGRPDDFVSTFLRGSSPIDFATAWDRQRYVAALGEGAYPELQLLQGRLRRSWIDGYLARIVQRDATEVLNLTQPARLSALLRLIAANQSGELVKARLADQARIPASSITSYLDAAETLFLVSFLPPWTPNLTRREIGRPKALVEDPALALRLAGVPVATLAEPSGSDHLGGFLEGFVIAEMLRQQNWSDADYRLLHFRDRNGLEVDLIVELDDGSVIGIEVKASSTYKSEHFAELKALQQKLGDRFRGGFVLGTARGGYQYGDRLWGLPVAALWDWRA